MGVRSSYLRAVGLTAEEGITGGSKPFSAEEEEQFRRLAASPDIYERIARSIAPSVFGAHDMKKAIACLLFGGEFRIDVSNVFFFAILKEVCAEVKKLTSTTM